MHFLVIIPSFVLHNKDSEKKPDIVECGASGATPKPLFGDGNGLNAPGLDMPTALNVGVVGAAAEGGDL